MIGGYEAKANQVTSNENDEHRQLRSARNAGYARTHTERNCSLSLMLGVLHSYVIKLK